MNKAQITTYLQALPWNDLKLKATKLLPKVIFVILIIIITQTVAELTWSFFTPEPARPSKNGVVVNKNNPYAVPTKVSTANSALSEVSSFHLFGDAKKQQAVAQKVIDAPETRLRLDLKGVFSSTNAKEALAIISSSKGKDKTYRIGDKVTDGVILHAVYADRVILKRNGQMETLRLPKPKAGKGALYTAKPSISRSSKPNAPSLAGNHAKRLRKMRDTLLKDPAKIWQQVRINPVMKAGKVQGYTLSHNDKALMKALNIRKTDIITGVNGESLSDPSTLYGLMNSLSDQNSLELTIERNGQPQTIQLSF